MTSPQADGFFFGTGEKNMCQWFTLFGDIGGINKALGFLMLSGSIHFTLTGGMNIIIVILL